MCQRFCNSHLKFIIALCRAYSLMMGPCTCPYLGASARGIIVSYFYERHQVDALAITPANRQTPQDRCGIPSALDHFAKTFPTVREIGPWAAVAAPFGLLRIGPLTFSSRKNGHFEIHLWMAPLNPVWVSLHVPLRSMSRAYFSRTPPWTCPTCPNPYPWPYLSSLSTLPHPLPLPLLPIPRPPPTF